MKTFIWRMLPLMVFMVLALFLWRGLSLDPRALPSVKLGKALPEFRLPRLDDPNQTLSRKDLKGQLVLLNVWASWCPACVDEQVFLLSLARQGVLLYGLNYKDNAQEAREWLKEWGNPYQQIVQDKEGRFAIDLGVYGAPETFLIDKNGLIQYRHAGILTADIWEKDFLPRIKALEKSA